MGTKLSRQIKGPDKEIISKKCLNSFLECVVYLKQNSHHFGLFYHMGSRPRSREILSRLERGDPDLLRALETSGGPLEAASALKMYLIKIKSPIMPARVQELVIADNPGVSPRVVALDALGLLRQEASGRHLRLIIAVLELLHCVSMNSITSELDGSHAALVMLPLFFSFTVDVLPHWRRIAAVFNEIIMCTPILSEDDFSLRAHVAHAHINERPSGDLVGRDFNPILNQDWTHELVNPNVLAMARANRRIGGEGTRPLLLRVLARGRLHPLLRAQSPLRGERVQNQVRRPAYRAVSATR